MLILTQYLLLALYAALPVGFLYWSARRRAIEKHWWPIASSLIVWIAGAAVGVLLLYLNARILGGRISISESIRLVYFCIGAACLIKLIDRLLLRGVGYLAGVRFDAAGRPRPPLRRTRAAVTLVAQRIILLAFIISYIFGLLIAYRPKVHLAGDPGSQKLTFAMADFSAIDALGISGWWIAASPRPSLVAADEATQWARRTVLLCHGIGAGKEKMLPLAKLLADRGYNVLVFDFRGYGASGGNFTTYGKREAFDVLGAVRWVKANHTGESGRIYGIGLNTGAAALIAAAAHPSPEGKALDALVLYEPFASLEDLAADVTGRALPAPVAWLVRNVSIPVASLHAGGRLSNFNPSDLIEDVWPRPVLFVHGRGQSFIPVQHGMDLYRAALQPKQQFWPSENYEESHRILRRARDDAALLTEMVREYLGTSLNVSEDGGVQYRTLEFLRSAEEVPIL